MKVKICVLEQEFEIEVGTQEPVVEIKKKIEKTFGIPISSQSLWAYDWELLDGLDMEDYPIISEGTKIDLKVTTLPPPPEINHSKKTGIFEPSLSFVVQTSSSLLNGAKIPIVMSESSTVNELRRLLLSTKSLPLDDYLFIHRQRVMRDGFSLRWHGVDDGDFLFVFKGTVTPGEF